MVKAIFAALLVFVLSVSVAAAVVFGQTVYPTVTTRPSPTVAVQGTSTTMPSGAPNTGRGGY
jgi:hypothetical protein